MANKHVRQENRAATKIQVLFQSNQLEFYGYFSGVRKVKWDVGLPSIKSNSRGESTVAEVIERSWVQTQLVCVLEQGILNLHNTQRVVAPSNMTVKLITYDRGALSLAITR